MAPQSDIERLQLAWRALSGSDRSEGWRTIPICLKGLCRILAGRHFPGNEEALVVGFPAISLPAANHLPQGRGFRVAGLPDGVLGEAYSWISLSRQPLGSSDFFSMMASDVVRLLESAPETISERLLGLFLSRIRAWQAFMGRNEQGVLRTEAETGLDGELLVLRALLGAGFSGASAVDIWKGPLNGLHDFSSGNGAIEVKTTVSVNGFPARVGSLEQLDPSLTQPLFLVGVRLAVDNTGTTLPDLMGMLRAYLVNDALALSAFESRLLHAGYLEALADSYTRRFAFVGMTVFEVVESFPGLARCHVDVAIRQAMYELDLDLLNVPVVTLEQAFTHLRGDSLGTSRISL